MPGMIMFCVATLTQYWVRGFFGSAAQAWADEQMKRATATAQVVLLRRFMIRTSLEKVCLVSLVCFVQIPPAPLFKRGILLFIPLCKRGKEGDFLSLRHVAHDVFLVTGHCCAAAGH